MANLEFGAHLPSASSVSSPTESSIFTPVDQHLDSAAMGQRSDGQGDVGSMGFSYFGNTMYTDPADDQDVNFADWTDDSWFDNTLDYEPAVKSRLNDGQSGIYSMHAPGLSHPVYSPRASPQPKMLGSQPINETTSTMGATDRMLQSNDSSHEDSLNRAYAASAVSIGAQSSGGPSAQPRSPSSKVNRAASSSKQLRLVVTPPQFESVALALPRTSFTLKYRNSEEVNKLGMRSKNKLDLKNEDDDVDEFTVNYDRHVRDAMRALVYSDLHDAPTNHKNGKLTTNDQREEWDRIQLQSQQELNSILLIKGIVDEVEGRARQLVEEIVAVHKYGYQRTTLKVDTTSTCSQRWQVMLDVLKHSAHIRKEVFESMNTKAFVAAPEAYYNAKVNNLWVNLGKKQAIEADRVAKAKASNQGVTVLATETSAQPRDKTSTSKFDMAYLKRRFTPSERRAGKAAERKNKAAIKKAAKQGVHATELSTFLESEAGSKDEQLEDDLGLPDTVNNLMSGVRQYDEDDTVSEGGGFVGALPGGPAAPGIPESAKDTDDQMGHGGYHDSIYPPAKKARVFQSVGRKRPAEWMAYDGMNDTNRDYSGRPSTYGFNSTSRPYHNMSALPRGYTQTSQSVAPHAVRAASAYGTARLPYARSSTPVAPTGHQDYHPAVALMLDSHPAQQHGVKRALDATQTEHNFENQSLGLHSSNQQVRLANAAVPYANARPKRAPRRIVKKTD